MVFVVIRQEKKKEDRILSVPARYTQAKITFTHNVANDKRAQRFTLLVSGFNVVADLCKYIYCIQLLTIELFKNVLLEEKKHYCYRQ